jgi:hypothetical protein
MSATAWLFLLGSAQGVELRSEKGRVELRVDGEAVGAYVYEDATLRRPFFANLRVPGGPPVTRPHPPVEGKDATDHATMHPGVWLAFGDLGGADFWRNKAAVEHVRFVEEPRDGTFSVLNRYRAGERVVCEETCRVAALRRPAGVLLVLDSAFSGPEPFSFGDQEEMGLGVRVATPFTVRAGGRMKDNAGRTNEKEIWGKPGEWCDYSGVADGKRAGLLVAADPANPLPSRLHARDYGLLVFNPFGRKVFKAGEASRTEVRPGETLRLRFGVLLYRADGPEGLDLRAEAAGVLEAMKGLRRP